MWIASVAGCSTLGWYGQAVRGQFELVTAREDIADVIADPAADDHVADRLRRVEALRAFARDELLLDPGDAYRTYVDLDRPAVVWNVIATPPDSMTPETWCYPVAGCVPYRGWFRQATAERHARRLAARNLDTAVSPATAYSTLGWFEDPVLSTMLGGGEAGLAGMLFHEIAHRTVYVPGEAAFNEAYATFIADEGVRRWLANNPAALARWRHGQALNNATNRLLLETRAELEKLYARDLPEAAMRADKRAVFRRLRARADRLGGLWGLDGLAWFERPLNNAHLALVATYEAGVDAMAGLMADCGNDMTCFQAEIHALAAADPAARRRFLGSGN